MYKLFTDKTEIFEAQLQIKGASLNKSFCRLLIETSDLNLVFDGKIKSNGKCEIPIRKLHALLEEGTTGNIKLEVIAENTYFVPWESNFKVETGKKVVAEVSIKDSKPMVEARVSSVYESNTDDYDSDEYDYVDDMEDLVVNDILENLEAKDITIFNINENTDILSEIIEYYTDGLSPQSIKSMPEKILSKLAKEI